MAKQKPKRDSNFYESLAAAPRVTRDMGVTAGHDMGAWVKNLPWTRWREDVIAVNHDIARSLGKIWGLRHSEVARRRAKILTLVFIGSGLLIGANMAASAIRTYGRYMGSPSMIMNSKNTGTTIVDRNGEVLFQGFGAVQRHEIPLSEIPDSLKSATLATEDPGFYSHSGFSWKGTARAAFQDLAHNGKVQGGSTITQQLVKNTLLNNQKSFTRKYKEVILSMDLERRYSKDQILQMYLNTIYYGEGAYGVESAAQTYFHKPAKDLTLEESALLAGLPQSPTQYDPNFHPQAAKNRRDYVLSRMQEEKKIDAQTADATQQLPVVASTRVNVVKAPHFVFYVLDQLRSEYGEDMVVHGGIVVHTTLDYKKQEQAQQIVKEQVDKLSSHHVSNGGLVSVDTHSGDIMAMVGSANYEDPNFGAVNVMLSHLQPGSSFKPIAYATAFEKGYNGATKVDDKPLKLPSGDGTVYAPVNYDGKFRGPVLLRRALANSLNIPAVEVLQYAGVHDTIATAHSLGIEPQSLSDESRYGLSLVLGGGEVRPIDMAAVYGAFANQGNSVTPRAVTKVDDKFGKDITKSAPQPQRRVIDPRIAFMITNILSDVNARKEEFGQRNPLELTRPAAAKTGTTNDFRDNWTVGYTPDLVTAVWVGNNDHTPMNNVDGITGAAPIWHSYMEYALAGTPVSQFQVPAGVVFAKVCAADGGLADPKDSKAINEVFLVENQQTKKCGWASPKKEEPKKDEAKPEDKKEETSPNPTPPATEPGSGGPNDNPPTDGGSGNPGAPSPKKTPTGA